MPWRSWGTLLPSLLLPLVDARVFNVLSLLLSYRGVRSDYRRQEWKRIVRIIRDRWCCKSVRVSGRDGFALSLSLSPSPQGCARMQSLPARSVYVCVSVCCMLCMCDFNNVRSVREFILHVSRLFLCLLLPVVRSLCTQANPRRYLWFIAEGEFCCFHWSVHTWGKETMRETERERESERDGECICGEKRRITSKKQHSRWPVAELQVPFYYCITLAACACMREEKVVCVCDRREPHLLSVALTYLLVTRFFATVTFVTLAIYIVLCRVANSAYER